MKFITLTCIALVCFLSSIAQDKKTDVIVTLKNTSKFKGYVISDSKNEPLSVFVSDKDSITIPYNQISRIQYLGETNNRKYTRIGSFYNVTEIGMMFGSLSRDANISSSMSAQTVFGYSVNQYIKSGIGVGFDQYGGTCALPVFLSLRGDMLNKKISPVYFVNGGYSAAWGEDESLWQEWADLKGGKMIEAGFGIRFSSLDGYSLLISLGYKVQDTTFTQYDWQGEVSSVTDRIHRRMRFSIGIGF